jgi:hypothetical protein
LILISEAQDIQKEKKHKRGRQLGEKKRREQREFLPSSLRCCEIRKAGSKRERREKKR